MESHEQPQTQSSRYAHSRRTLRLTFSYQGSNVRLDSQQSVEMITPPPNPYPIQEGQTGFWYELRDREGHILYQRAVHNPIRFDVEIYSNDPPQSMSRQKVDNPSGIFVLFVPDVPEGHSVVIFSSPLNPEDARKPAQELARFTIAQESREGKQQ